MLNIEDPPSLLPENITTNKPTTTTVQFGIQVDLTVNPEKDLHSDFKCHNQQEEDRLREISQQEKKREKKKIYKRRKKEKSHQQQREAKMQIGNIIQEFYERSARFEDYAEKLEELVEIVYNNDFREFLDSIIRLRVNNIQKQIWQYTQQILYQNPFEKGDDHVFYSQMVQQIYQRFLQIQESSKQIEQVINIYLKHTYSQNDSKQEIIYNNLSVNTFNYMIQTDETLKNLIHICDRKITNIKPKHRKMLDHILTMVSDDQATDDDQDANYFHHNQEDCLRDQCNSTSISEEDDTEDRKKRKKKIRESDISHTFESIVLRLQAMVIKEDDRIPCRVQQDWKDRMQMRAKEYQIK